MQIYANMTLDDLKTGMIVTTRNGREYTVIRDRVADELTNSDVIVRHDNVTIGWIPLDDYDYRMRIKDKWGSTDEWDIVKVERGTHPFEFMNLNYRKEDRVLLWERTPAVKLTVAEIEERLGYAIEIVSENNEED